MPDGESTGANARPLDDTVAETGPGLSDDAVLEGELAPGELAEGSDEAVARLRREGWAPGAQDGAQAESDAEKAEAETEAHPS